MFRPRSYFGKSLTRRLIGLAALVSVCASFMPLPLGSIPSREKDQSQPFPCQHRPCGCASAEQCWKQCCCFTNAEKIVWARDNGIIPPDYVVEAAQSEFTAKVVKAETVVKKQCSHCVKSTSVQNGVACCETRSRPTCCSTSSGHSTEHQPEETLSTADDSTRYVIGIEMMNCRGQGLFWNSLPWAVIPVVPVPKLVVDPGNWDRPRSVIAAFIAAEPPEPPPRLA
ncbi:hypothetical protein [Gimesia algae]|uniref:Uncharacterized protein n=1 Tax=Gimesia algae TaxID=2527971 RepID=A0A517VA91_9PLAN|nr:hypothetical protein [Gimesia algae]QDT89916.1 hypothetical protein Pan161_15490 [Gimesia algae]